MYVTVEVPSGKTVKQVYSFYLRDAHSRLELVFQMHRKLMRPTSRHRNWNTVERWDWYNSRDITTKVRPEVPQFVIDDALKQVREAITVVLDRK